MTIGMTARQGKRWGLSALAATVCWIGGPVASLAGDGPSVFGWKPQGPILKTLDAFAGGIELVLEKTLLSNGKSRRGCDSPSCDDGCDAITLHQLDLQRGDQMAVPEVYHPSPSAEPMIPPPPRRQGPAADDSLFDPFADDPQTRAVPQRFSPMVRPAAAAESARPQVRKSVKAAGFAGPNRFIGRSL